ncbi:NUDIX hydrolase [Alteromonas gracilis]|uniref:NUDIX hydrolase n=1 Tax=Alteromonas gracilis TaxID=1479524 RepID=UPI00321C2FD2
MSFFFRLSSILAVLTLFACTPSAPEIPSCRVSDSLALEFPDIQDHDYDAAACIITSGNTVLMIRHRLSGKLDFAGGGKSEGKDGDKSAACNAHRETWEETGFNVEVKQFLGTTSRGLLLFGCDLNAGLNDLPTIFDAPPWAAVEVKSLEKVDPFMLDHNDLRFSDDLIPLRDGYIAIKNKQ